MVIVANGYLRHDRRCQFETLNLKSDVLAVALALFALQNAKQQRYFGPDGFYYSLPRYHNKNGKVFFQMYKLNSTNTIEPNNWYLRSTLCPSRNLVNRVQLSSTSLNYYFILDVRLDRMQN